MSKITFGREKKQSSNRRGCSLASFQFLRAFVLSVFTFLFRFTLGFGGEVSGLSFATIFVRRSVLWGWSHLPVFLGQLQSACTKPVQILSVKSSFVEQGWFTDRIWCFPSHTEFFPFVADFSELGTEFSVFRTEFSVTMQTSTDLRRGRNFPSPKVNYM